MPCWRFAETTQAQTLSVTASNGCSMARFSLFKRLLELMRLAIKKARPYDIAELWQLLIWTVLICLFFLTLFIIWGRQG
jgi:hypothetical protein